MPSPSAPTEAGSPRRVLVLDGDEQRRTQAIVDLCAGGIEAVAAPDPEVAARELESGGYDAVFCHPALADRLTHLPLDRVVIVTGGPGDLERAVAAARFEEARRRRKRAAPSPAPARAIVGGSEAMRELMSTVSKAAAHKATALIGGESGTGKELVARALHELSPRASGPFVAVNCGAIPATLLESELFGHVKGAFTGAVRDKPGLFEQADGGTLFLDEIGELGQPLQVKLLRALQEDEVRRVGATEATEVDVRVVAATVRDLAAEVEAGRFRRDLFFRLNVLPITLPPLRDRGDDVHLLADHFLATFAERHGKPGLRFADDARDLLRAHPWPGNVRELENAVERAVVLCEQDVIDASLLAEKLDPRAGDPVRSAIATGDLSIKRATRAVERELISRALEATGGNRTNAAKLLEISHRALLYKIKEYEL